jgi:TRAP-type transport system periplasmic protein|tara:strand:+ start:645 stop:1631 length:987 start_codon:yes stop_codon:yes gene_type:complete
VIKELLFAATAAVMLVGQTASAERLSLSTWGSPKHSQVAQFVPLFEKLLKEKSDGNIRLKIFDGGEMVKQQFVATAIPQGAVDISLTTLDNWSGRVADVGILTNPLWDKSMEWSRDNLLPGKPIFDYFDGKLRTQGAVIIALFDIGPPVITANFAVEGPQSFGGKAIRSYSKGSAEVLQTLGAAPTVLGVGEVYSALQRGTIQGSMGGLGGAVGLKHYEVTSNLFAPNGVMGTLIHGYVMNKDKFDKMSPESRAALMDAATQARNHMQQYAIDDYAKLLAKVASNGNKVTEVKPGSAMWKEFEKKLAPLKTTAKSAYSIEVQELVVGN